MAKNITDVEENGEQKPARKSIQRILICIIIVSISDCIDLSQLLSSQRILFV